MTIGGSRCAPSFLESFLRIEFLQYSIENSQLIEDIGNKVNERKVTLNGEPVNAYNKSVLNKNGFTLIEIIVSLVLVGIITTVAGMGIVLVTQKFYFAKDNAETAQKGQVALTRMMKELTVISAVNTGTATSINFNSYKAGVLGTRQISWAGSSGDPLVFDDDTTDGVAGDTLTDNVSSFALAYYDTYTSASQASWSSSTKVIEVTLTLTGANDVASAFTVRVAPRNL